MTRKVSMTLALFLTTVAGFIITVSGMNTGLFGGDSGGEPSPTLVAPDNVADTPPTAPPPQVIEQVVYRDEYVRIPVSSGAEQAGAGQSAPAAGDPVTVAPQPPDEGAPGQATASPSSPSAPQAGGSAQAVDIQGTVTGVTGEGFTLTGTRFGTVVVTVNSSTEFEGQEGMAGMHPGDRVEAKVLAGGGNTPTGPDGSWVAVHVHVEDE